MKTISKYLIANKRDLLFYLIIILNSMIIFGTKYFPTQDGCSHAYNSNILYNLLFGDKEAYSNFFSLNTELVPNWFTNFLMLIFNAFMPFNVAEKIILLIYFVSFPLLFKHIVSYFNSDKTYLVFLIFPFTHFCVLYYGFFNFAYGLLFFFLGIIYWLKLSKSFSIKNFVWLTVILLFTYFSHIFAFIALSIFCLLNEFIDVVINFGKESIVKQLKDKFVLFIKSIGAFIIPAILTIMYFNKRPSEGKEQFFKTEELNSLLLNGDVFKSYGGDEDLISKALIYIVFGVILYALIYKITNKISIKEKLLDKTFVFFVFGLLILYFFYTKPNGDGYGGYINIRLALYTCLIFTLWATIVIKREYKFELLILICALFLNYKLYECKQGGLKWLNSSLKNFEGFDKKIKEGSVIAPVYWAGNYNWLGGHYSNVLGAEKKCIVLENYEASTGYFPIVWKNNTMPHTAWGDLQSAEQCTDYVNRLNNYPFGKINYVIIYGEAKNIEWNDKFLSELAHSFSLIHSKGDVFLYERK